MNENKPTFNWNDFANALPVLVLCLAMLVMFIGCYLVMGRHPYLEIGGENIDYWRLVSPIHGFTPSDVLIWIPRLTLVGLTGFVLTRFKNWLIFVILLLLANGCGFLSFIFQAGGFNYQMVKHLQSFEMDNQIHHLALYDQWVDGMQFPHAYIVYECDTSGNYCSHLGQVPDLSTYPSQMDILPEITVIIDPVQDDLYLKIGEELHLVEQASTSSFLLPRKALL